MQVEVPFNCLSEVWIPAKKSSKVYESGILVVQKKEITRIGKTDDFEVYLIGSGNYHFEVR